MTRILNDCDAATDILSVLDLRFDGDGLHDAVLGRDSLQLRLIDGLEELAQKQDAEVRVADELLLV